MIDKNNKQYYIQNINIIRNIGIDQKKEINLNATKNFCLFVKKEKIKKDANILFVLNSLEEFDIDQWINQLIKKELNIYGLNLINKKNNFIKINEGYKKTWHINRYQLEFNKKLCNNDVKFDYVFLPVCLFNNQKKCLDNELDIINPLLKKIKHDNLKIVGYSYSLNKFNINLTDEKEFDVEYLITNNYIL